LTPDGDLAWKVGIAPDVEVRQPNPGSILDITDEEIVTAAALDASGDSQLSAAMATLQGSATPVA
jgi:hypothetical protein